MKFEDRVKEKIQASGGTISLATAITLCANEYPREHKDYLSRFTAGKATSLNELRVYSISSNSKK